MRTKAHVLNPPHLVMLSRSVIDLQRIDEDEQGSDRTLHDLLYWWSPFFLLNHLELLVFEMLRVRLECWGLDGNWQPISRPMKFEHGYYGSGYWPAFGFCQVYWTFLCMRVRVIVVKGKLGRENNVKEKNLQWGTMREIRVSNDEFHVSIVMPKD